ncbi:CHAP domain-containing protein [Actinomadura xylanilytica]|uniref:CHAP domain-containing protein n=1 Tax=Actinomadura xylanilytica TaxID=887459 RepID=UPI00255AA4AD|nr:CHAP domain-containing protein [Actinomadura xylanilytica]MDL4770668.1 CHAP domain-containing protein [Actinomadura xylanilytica]
MPKRNSVNFLPTEKLAAGVAVGAVLAGSLGFAVATGVSGDEATAGTATGAAQAAAMAGPPAKAKAKSAHKSAAKSAPKIGTMSKQKAAQEGYSVAPRAVKSSEVIKLAEKQVGIKEGKKGQTKFHDWYVSSPAAKQTAKRDGGKVAEYNGAQWCNMFVSWLGAQLGVKNMGFDAYTVEHASWLKKTGRWGDTAKPGAIVFYDWDKGSKGKIGDIDHVGVVAKDNGDGTIKTVEGNTSDAVQKHVRSKSQVVGYGYPDYAK